MEAKDISDTKHDELFKLGVLKESTPEEKKILIKKAEAEWKTYLKNELRRAEEKDDGKVIKHYKDAVDNFDKLLKDPSAQRLVIATIAKEIKVREYYEGINVGY